jgi:hypothetical protein
MLFLVSMAALINAIFAYTAFNFTHIRHINGGLGFLSMSFRWRV